VGGLYNETGCVCVTKESVKPISDIHNRQPILLEEDQIQKWLSGDYIIKDTISKNILIHKVSSYVNSPKNNDHKCVQPI
jgi:putative SOS response-associated peptidase YedK